MYVCMCAESWIQMTKMRLIGNIMNGFAIISMNIHRFVWSNSSSIQQICYEQTTTIEYIIFKIVINWNHCKYIENWKWKPSSNCTKRYSMKTLHNFELIEIRPKMIWKVLSFLWTIFILHFFFGLFNENACKLIFTLNAESASLIPIFRC